MGEISFITWNDCATELTASSLSINSGNSRNCYKCSIVCVARVKRALKGLCCNLYRRSSTPLRAKAARNRDPGCAAPLFFHLTAGLRPRLKPMPPLRGCCDRILIVLFDRQNSLPVATWCLKARVKAHYFCHPYFLSSRGDFSPRGICVFDFFSSLSRCGSSNQQE